VDFLADLRAHFRHDALRGCLFCHVHLPSGVALQINAGPRPPARLSERACCIAAKKPVQADFLRHIRFLALQKVDWYHAAMRRPTRQPKGTPMATSKTQTDYTDFAKRAFAPAARFNETLVGNIERVARFQYEVTGDLMQFALDQMHASVKAKDLPTLLAKQREIATKFAEKATARQQTLAEMAAESQASLAKWMEDAASVATGKAA
jgi:phasin family protein